MMSTHPMKEEASHACSCTRERMGVALPEPSSVPDCSGKSIPIPHRRVSVHRSLSVVKCWAAPASNKAKPNPRQAGHLNHFAAVVWPDVRSDAIPGRRCVARGKVAMISLSSSSTTVARGVHHRQECLSLGSQRVIFLEQTRIVSINTCLIQFTPLEYILFRALVAQPRMLVLNSELCQQCAFPGSVDHSRVIERHIDNVRRKLRQSGVGGLRILRVVSYGYVLLPDLEEETPGEEC